MCVTALWREMPYRRCHRVLLAIPSTPSPMLKLWKPLVAVLAPLLVATTACSDPDIVAPDASAAPSRTAPPMAVAVAVHPGRALAANCFQCHGTDGNAGELKIAGESASEIVGELNEMRAAPPGRNIMNVHALAYTLAEIALIADYFSKQGH